MNEKQRRMEEINQLRAQDLERLVKMREGKMDEFRQLTLRLYYYWTLTTNGNKETDALVSTFSLNSQFSEPLTEEEVTRQVAISKEAVAEYYELVKNPRSKKKGYEYKNSTIIQRLKINRYEQRKLQTIIEDIEQNRRNPSQKGNLSAFNKRELNRIQLTNKIQRLRAKGLTQAEVAIKIDKSLGTVQRYWNKKVDTKQTPPPMIKPKEMEPLLVEEMPTTKEETLLTTAHQLKGFLSDVPPVAVGDIIIDCSNHKELIVQNFTSYEEMNVDFFATFIPAPTEVEPPFKMTKGYRFQDEGKTWILIAKQEKNVPVTMPVLSEQETMNDLTKEEINECLDFLSELNQDFAEMRQLIPQGLFEKENWKHELVTRYMKLLLLSTEKEKTLSAILSKRK